MIARSIFRIISGLRHVVALGFVAVAPRVGATKVVTYYYDDPSGTPLLTTDGNGTVKSSSDVRAYGKVAIGSPSDGPAFVGHIADVEVDLIYMQQRYYDPDIGRFISVDPKPIDPYDFHNTSRFTYANNNPYLFVDPDGAEAQVAWAAKDRATVTIRYTTTGRALPFSSTAMNLTTASRLSGLVNIGGTVVSVTTKMQYLSNGSGQSGINTVNVVQDTNGVTGTGRAETNAIGGNLMKIGATGVDAATVETAAHEFGHIAGAGDQYKGGINVLGQTLPADVLGSPNIMKDLTGSGANDQTLREIIEARTNTNSCATGVSAANGAC